MSMPDDPPKQTGPLARVGQNDAFAGVTRIGIVLFGVVMTAIFAWGASDVRGSLNDIKENQRAIIAIGDRTTRLEDTTANTATSIREFRLWAESQVGILVSNGNSDSKSINALDRRVFCLESHTKCPQ